MMLAALIVFAQEVNEVAKDAAKDAARDPIRDIFSGPMLPLLLIMGAFYFLMIRPAQQREKKQREEIFANLKKNDEVLTSSGLIGIVHGIKEGEDEVTIKLDDTAKARILKSSIVQIRNKKDEPPSTAIQK